MTLDQFVETCRKLAVEQNALPQIRSAMQELVSDPRAVDALHPAPTDCDAISGLSETLFEDDTVSIMVVHTPPGVKQPPHDHLMSVVIGGYRGTETQRLFRRTPNGATPIEFTGDDVVGVGDVFSLGQHGVHAINATGPEWAGAVHVYLGRLSAVERSLFHPETLAEEPLTLDAYDAYCVANSAAS